MFNLSPLFFGAIPFVTNSMASTISVSSLSWFLSVLLSGDFWVIVSCGLDGSSFLPLCFGLMDQIYVPVRCHGLAGFLRCGSLSLCWSATFRVFMFSLFVSPLSWWDSFDSGFLSTLCAFSFSSSASNSEPEFCRGFPTSLCLVLCSVFVALIQFRSPLIHPGGFEQRPQFCKTSYLRRSKGLVFLSARFLNLGDRFIVSKVCVSCSIFLFFRSFTPLLQC